MLKITEYGVDYEIVYTNDNVRNVLLRHIERQQARIDALMLEHCPDEMTPEQLAEWGRHQRAMLTDGLAGFQACKGTNCGCTDGRSHSAECAAEHDAAAALPYDEKYLHCPDTGAGWKCYVCGYGGTANNYANTFCVNCHCHR